MDDLTLTRLLAERGMGWRIYTDETDWRVHCLNERGKTINACCIKEDGTVLIALPSFGIHKWRPLESMDDAWMAVGKLRDAWSAATDGVSGLDPDFPRPFDDTYFFDLLRRNADRRWPWAFLYVTPRAIVLASLRACGVEVSA